MKPAQKNVIKDQELFFNQNSQTQKVYIQDKLFYNYVNKEILNGLEWISDKKILLDYGCGTGDTVDVFFAKRNPTEYKLWGVDIAADAVARAQEKYPKHLFFKIYDNKINMLASNSVQGAYMVHVLHHSYCHMDIFTEIYDKLEVGGKFFLTDLSSNNPFVGLGRALFGMVPNFVKNKFSGDDLVVDGKIPDKYKVNVSDKVKQLKDAGFEIVEVGHGHLFFFLFSWIDRFLPLSKINIIRRFYGQLIKLESIMLQYDFFKNYAEVMYIKAIKSSTNS